MKKAFLSIILIFVGIFVGLLPFGVQASSLPDGFVYLETVIPDIEIDLRYQTSQNFVGIPIDGYLKPRCILTHEAAKALKNVQDELRPFGLGLKIFDAYRPQMAVDHFVRWAADLDDIKMKPDYYPEIDKKDLFNKGFIASKSGHTRGSTVDLTLVSKQAGGTSLELDMGTPFDMFSPQSAVKHPSIPPAARAHRMLLQILMRKHGFKPYHREWWHFTLAKEPFPKTYFKFFNTVKDA